MKKKKFGKGSTVLLLIILFVGLSVMLYPTVSNWWNARVQSYAIASYNQEVEKIDNSEKEAMLAQARVYNQALATLYAPFSDYLQAGEYEEILNINGTGIMGYVSIPKINVELPIYHGTSAEVLNVAIGHLQGTSLPVGGENTHTVISGHRGLPSARLFTDIDQLTEGDTFTITVLDEILTYEVEEIRIVLPSEIENLYIETGRDMVTLMTCTPYGINTHRLLVRAHRIDTIYPHNVKVTADAIQLDSTVAAAFVAMPLFFLLLIFWMFGGKRKKKISVSDLEAMYHKDLQNTKTREENEE